MTVFGKKENKPTNTVFRLPVDNSAGSKGLLRSEYVQEQNSILYPTVAQMPKEEVEQFLAAGMVGPVQAKAEGVTRQKQLDVYNEVIEVTSLDQKTPEQAISELETLRDENPFLKAYVSPAVIEALKQSDNVFARQAAQGKLSNVLIATELLNNKMSEANTGFINGVGDFFDVLGSDLPIVSAFNVDRRKELSDRFLQLMDSDEDAAVIRTEMESIINEAADMGFFTDSNRFYLNDFLGLTLEQGKEGELAFQQAFAAIDILASLTVLGDAGKLVGFTKGPSRETTEALMSGVMKDNVAGAVDPSTWKESLLTSERILPRTPAESTAVKEVELELRATEEAIQIRLASGSAIDDDAFNAVKQDLIAKSKARAQKSGNLRYIDANVAKDSFDNISMTEFYGTTKGKAFASETAAKIYADQILGEVVPVPGQTKQWMVKKTSNIKTGIYSQGATPNDIIADLGLYKSLDTDELGRGFFANFGSPLSQTDYTNNAVLKQGEFARAKAMELVERDVERQLRIVGEDGKDAVERVYDHIRDGQFASMRDAPTIAQFDDMFFQVNGRRATEAELRLHSLKLEWSNTDWFLTADVHFKKAVERGIEIIVPQDGIEVGAVKTTAEANAGRQVWDIDSGSYVSIDTLNPDRQIYKLVEPMQFDGKLHDLVASATPKTRALKHTDVMGYNAGGSRLYPNNRTNFILKQDTEYTLADGTKRQGIPRAILVAKTEKEAAKAQTEINNIISALHDIVNPKPFLKADDYLSVVQTKYKDANLNELIARNSGWNTDVHGVKELVEWATESGYDIRKPVSFVSDGQPLVKGDDIIGDVTYNDIAISPGPLKMGDFRRDTVLMGYGGQKLPTIAPFESISRSLMSSVAKQTEMAYETRSIMRLFKTALEKNLVPRDNIALIRNMSLRQKARNMIIDTGTDFGKKLEIERKKILVRLDKQRHLDNAYQKAREGLANMLWDKGWKKASEKIDALSADPVAGTRGIVFDAYLGLGAIDQFYVQASQMINIVAMADKAIGVQSAGLAPYFRKTLMNGHPEPTKVMAQLTSGVLGITPEQFLSMVDTFKKSGKAYVNASVADLGEDSAGKVLFRKTREKLRIAYTEGELMSRITAHIAASMEYIKKFGPEADLASQHAQRWTMHRSDVFTNGMSSTSRTFIEQLPMAQFMSFSMRMAEWYFSGLGKDLANVARGGSWKTNFGVLPLEKKVKLFTFQLGMYGAAAIPGGGYLLDKYNREYGVELSESDFYQLRHGLIDNLIRIATGVETELGRRLAWGEGLFETLSNFQEQSMGATLLGPLGSFGSTVLDRVNQMIFNIRMGQTSFSALSGDVLDVFRSIKSVNMAHNAYDAFRYEVINARSGDQLVDKLPTGEAVAIALGVPLHKVNELWREAEFSKKDTEWYRSQAKRVSNLYREWYDERERNGSGTEREAEIIAGIEYFNKYYQEYMPEINRYIDKKFITMLEEQTVEILKRETKRKAAE